MAEIIGLLIAIGALLAMLPGLMHWTVLGSEEVRDTAIAQQAGIFEKAAEQYLSQNSGALLTTATPTAPVIVTTAELQTGGFLPSNYTSTNVYGQTWELEVLQPTPGVLQAVAFTTGGQSIEDEEAARISGLIGASGGFVPVNNSGAYPQGSTLTAYGTQGAWTLNLKNFQGITKGELASYVSLVDSTGQVTSNNYLYRYSVPGNSELNTMHTPLIMAAVESNGAACTTTGSIAQDGTGALLSCQAGVWTQVGNSSWKAPVGSYAALPASGNALGDVRLTTDTSRAYAWDGAGWKALAVDQNGNLDVPAALTVGGSATVAGNVTASGNVSASGSIQSGGSISNNSASIGSNGEIVSNSPTWGLQTNSAGGATNAAGSIDVNDSYHREGGAYPWYSQLSAQVSTNTSNITSIENTLGTQGQQIATNRSNIGTIVTNLSNPSPCAGTPRYAYAALNSICSAAQNSGVNISYVGSFGPVGNSSTSYQTTCYNYFGHRLIQYPCTQTVNGPPVLQETNSSTFPELVTISEVIGNSGNSGGSQSNLVNNNGGGSYTGCAQNGGMGNTINVAVNGQPVGQVSDAAPYFPGNYQRQYTFGGTVTFAVPPGGTWQAAMTQMSCGELEAQVWGL